MNKGRRILAKIISFLVLLLFSACRTDSESPITIHMIGDSTMADKPSPETNPGRGWGQMMQQFFDEKVRVRNHAVNGRSTKSFIDEGRWDVVLAELKKGDYVIIQFGHNDQKYKDPARYTHAFTAYRHNLEKFVKDTRYRKAVPVICSSIVRRKFNEYNTLVDSHEPYPLVARMVAEENKCLFIDLQYRSEKLVSSLGPQESKDIYLWFARGENDYFPEGKEDNTHLSISGARAIAGMAVADLKSQDKDLAEHIKQLPVND